MVYHFVLYLIAHGEYGPIEGIHFTILWCKWQYIVMLFSLTFLHLCWLSTWSGLDLTGAWHNVLWAFRAMPRRTMGETPYALAYGIGALYLSRMVYQPSDPKLLKKKLMNKCWRRTLTSPKREERLHKCDWKPTNNSLLKVTIRGFALASSCLGSWFSGMWWGTPMSLEKGELGPNW